MTMPRVDVKNLKVALFIFAAVLSATLVTTYFFYHIENEKIEIEHKTNLTTATVIVDDLATSIYGPVASLSALMSANHAFGIENQTEQFHRFIKSRDLLKKFPSVIAWVYAPRLERDTLSQSIARIDKETGRNSLGYYPLEIFPPTSDMSYVAPVVMAEPPLIVAKALGFNLLSEARRRETAERALTVGRIQVSKPMPLKVDEPGVVLFHPVFSTETTPSTLEERKKKHMGYVVAAYTIQSLIASVKDKFDALGLHVDIHDQGLVGIIQHSKLDVSTLLSSSRGRSGNQGKWYPDELIQISDTGDNYRDIEVAGRIWRIVVEYKRSQGANIQQYITLTILISGGLLSLLASILVYQQQNWTTMLAARVVARTKALKDIQEELQKSHDQAEIQALSDPLTGLGNRRALNLNFNHLISDKSKDDQAIAILLFDIDFFKPINDTKGHDFGDKILMDFAEQAQEKLDENACFARLGGDEFAVLLTGPKGNCRAINAAAEILLNAISDVGKINDMPSLSGSVGIAKMGQKDKKLSDIMKHADIALYEAKNNGKGRLVKYTQSLGERETRKIAILSDVSKGLDRDEFVPFFHQFVDLKDNKIVGFEILARWNHKTKGILTPAAFWEALCDDTFATRISNMVMSKALKQAGNLKSLGWNVGRLGINTTEQMLNDKYFAENLIEEAQACGLSPKNLKIEVTERILLSRNPNEIIKTLEQLMKRDVSIAFDDFGTGFASLTHLRTFPIDCVKIDRTFIQELETDRKSRAIVSAISRMAQELGFTVIAEGIETENSKDLLRDLHCDTGQGFLFGKPTDIDGVAKLLQRDTSIAA